MFEMCAEALNWAQRLFRGLLVWQEVTDGRYAESRHDHDLTDIHGEISTYTHSPCHNLNK